MPRTTPHRGPQQQRHVPGAIRSLSTMAGPDYVDFFTVTTSGAADRSPEQWARAAVEEAAGVAGQFVWRMLCGLRLESRPSRDHVGGWKIAERGDRWVRLEAPSWFMTAHLVVHVQDEQLSMATFIQYDRPIARLLWPLLSIGHRAAMPGLLRQTTVRCASQAAKQAQGTGVRHRVHPRPSSRGDTQVRER